jgi:hypothetical protein
MKKILTACLLVFTAFAYAKEDECPSAADAAEAQNPNLYKNCDYSKTGLNGVLHRALTDKPEGAEERKKDDVIKASNEKAQMVIEKSAQTGNGEFSSAQQLQSVKFSLLERVALECKKGFVVEGEKYLPAENKSLRLELIYHCL